MEKDQIVHDLAMACLQVKQLPGNGIMIEETIEDYLKNSKIIRELLEEIPE